MDRDRAYWFLLRLHPGALRSVVKHWVGLHEEFYQRGI